MVQPFDKGLALLTRSCHKSSAGDLQSLACDATTAGADHSRSTDVDSMLRCASRQCKCNI